tara:strand:- start:1399 stop:1620 length:222 start_codon:yes stop_codon:yes gene_type:complete
MNLNNNEYHLLKGYVDSLNRAGFEFVGMGMDELNLDDLHVKLQSVREAEQILSQIVLLRTISDQVETFHKPDD